MNAAEIWWLGLMLIGSALWAGGAVWRGFIWKRIDGDSVALASALERSRNTMLVGGLLIAAGIGAIGAVELTP